MTAPRPDRTRNSLRAEPPKTSPVNASPAPPRRDRARSARRDNPDAPRTVARPRRANKNEEPSFARPNSASPTPEELDRWDEEWRGEWDHGDVDDSAAYEDELDVADQARDVEWLLDALDALDDPNHDDDEFDWE
jgi:hypothetical protein